MKFTLKALAVAAVASASSFTFADEPTSPHSVSGNIGVLSSYNLRGITNVPENSGATLQGGLDYTHASGFYAGWWGSTLDYSLAEEGRDAFENNFYLGYSHAVNDDLGLTIGTTYYYYYESDVESNGFELLLGMSYKDLGVTAQTLLEDTTWGNAGDTYLKASYSYALPKDFSLDTALGLYLYDKNGPIEAADTFSFRHFDIGLSKALADTGVTASMNYILGGYDRNDIKQKNKVVLGLGYSF
ncbi:TorF family putative porin [Acinetobacter indicus]|uniref:TorF family putative porin n=1 Tax=Acinetobacter indicus TaxID=756892 RepID=UPI001FA6E1FD|nr:TorF family putative porin [Acinetobacter indicus]UNW09790.1 TorF family putative porin [Acinetobacter indicus]